VVQEVLAVTGKEMERRRKSMSHQFLLEWERDDGSGLRALMRLRNCHKVPTYLAMMFNL